MQTFAEVKETVDGFVVSLGRRSSYSLDRIEHLLAKLGNPQESFRTVHIAGTSGKSSTAYYMASMLEGAGYRTGLSISPYLEELNERIQIGTNPVPEEVFCQEFSEFFEIVKKLHIKPTYFELFVAFSYWYFAKSAVDYAVIEVGLGGLLDATNTIKRPDKVCIVTDIGLDHIKILGNTIGEIASQKAGIIQEGNNVFMYSQGSEVDAAVQKRADEKQAVVHFARRLAEVPSDLPKFQQRNWNLAANALKFITARDEKKIEPQTLENTSKITVPGRLEPISIKGKTIILDGAHNPQKMHSMVESFRLKFPGARPAMLFAVGENKLAHLEEMIKEVKDMPAFAVITTFKKENDENATSIDTQKIAKYFDADKIIQEPDLDKALYILFSRPEDILLATGSLYLVGELRKRLLRSQ